MCLITVITIQPTDLWWGLFHQHGWLAVLSHPGQLQGLWVHNSLVSPHFLERLEHTRQITTEHEVTASRLREDSITTQPLPQLLQCWMSWILSQVATALIWFISGPDTPSPVCSQAELCFEACCKNSNYWVLIGAGQVHQTPTHSLHLPLLILGGAAPKAEVFWAHGLQEEGTKQESKKKTTIRVSVQVQDLNHTQKRTPGALWPAREVFATAGLLMLNADKKSRTNRASMSSAEQPPWSWDTHKAREGAPNAHFVAQVPIIQAGGSVGTHQIPPWPHTSLLLNECVEDTAIIPQFIVQRFFNNLAV